MRTARDGPWDSAAQVDLGRQPIPGELMAGVDRVFHLAGKAHALASSKDAGAEYTRINLQGTRDLLAAAEAQRVRAFVYFSSVKAGHITEHAEAVRADPADPYGSSKRAAERAVLASGGIPHVVVIRPALVYGPSPKGYLRSMIRAVRSGWFPPLPELHNGRSMIHRDDLIDAAMLCAADPRASGQTFILTDGLSYSTRQIYELILEALDREPPGWHLPLAGLQLAARVGDLIGKIGGRRFLLDSDTLDKLTGSAEYDGTGIRRILGFEPRRTLMDSMAEMVATTSG